VDVAQHPAVDRLGLERALSPGDAADQVVGSIDGGEEPPLNPGRFNELGDLDAGSEGVGAGEDVVSLGLRGIPTPVRWVASRSCAVPIKVAASSQRPGLGWSSLILLSHCTSWVIPSLRTSALAEAEARLTELEALDDDNLDAVLINIARISQLRDAYPNYYAETGRFKDFVVLRLDGRAS
jgi:hypothetical protein